MNACPVQFDPLAPEQLADPYPVYSQLRADRPVFHDAEHDLWIVSRYEDVMTVVRDPETYSSENAVRAATQPWPTPVLDTLARGWPLSPTLTDSDGEVHRRLRLLVSRAFTPKRIADMEDAIRRAVDELIDAFVSDGCADIIERFAWPLPMMAITDILGVPRDDFPQLHRWSYNWLRLMQATDPVGELVACAEDVVAMQRYFMDALEHRAGSEGTDLMSGLLVARVAGSEALTMIEAMRVAMNLIIAGHVTVTLAIGNGLVTLLAVRDQLTAMQQDPERIPTMVEEVLRFESPAQGLFRTVRTDTILAGVHIPAGARVMVHWASGNRDENVFERADVFDVTRNSANTHLAFGKGIHACPGAPLARLQLKVAIPRLFERLPRLRVAAGEASAVRDTIFFARGFKRLAMEWDTSDVVAA